MATQHLDRERNLFFLDLHGVLKRDAARIIRKRIEECARYGIGYLEIVYGTPDFFDGSIASALHRVAGDSPHVQRARMPREFLDDCESYATRVPKVTLPLKASAPAPIAGIVFTPFPASREPDPYLRRLCENPFEPGKQAFSAAEAAKFTGRGCRTQDVERDLGCDSIGLAELERYCREWRRPSEPEILPFAAPETPSAEPAPPAPEERWMHCWNDAAEAFAHADYSTAQARLNRCMELAGESSDARFLGRTLGALSILSGARREPVKSQAYHDSAVAALNQAPASATAERVEIATRVVETMVAEGRLADAIALLRQEREQLEPESPTSPAALNYLFAQEAGLRSRLDDTEGAAALLTRAIALVENREDFPAFAAANQRLSLGLLESLRGALHPALAHLTQAAEELDLHPEAFAQRFLCQKEIAAVADQLGYAKPAEEILRRLVDVPTLPGSHADLTRIGARIDLGSLYFRQERWADAEAVYLEAREETERAGSAPAARFDVHQNLGNTYTHMGRYSDAEREFAGALELAGELFPPTHPFVAQLHRNLGVLYIRAGRPTDARYSFRQALQIYDKCDGPPIPDAAEAHFSQAMLLGNERDWDEAEYHLRLALSMKNEIYGEDHPATAQALLKLGEVLLERKSLPQARPMLANTIRIMEHHRMDPALLIEAYSFLTRLHTENNNPKEARKAAQKAGYFQYLARQRTGTGRS